MIIYTLNDFVNNVICLTGVPNIIKVADNSPSTSAHRSVLRFTVQDSASIASAPDGTYYISVLGETISNVRSYENAINKNFYISSNNVSTAASIARAFRNCSNIITLYNVVQNSNEVSLIARDIFETNTQSTYSSNIPIAAITFIGTDGQDVSPLSMAKVSLDLYSGDNYITTLEKTCPKDTVSFNISPALETIAEVGQTKPWRVVIGYTTNYGQYNSVGTMNNNRVAVGYMVNQGENYIMNSSLTLAQNVSRGNAWQDKGNHTLLYIYQPTLPISFYRGLNSDGDITITYLDSAFNDITGDTISYSSDEDKLVDMEVVLNESVWNDTFYLDVEIDGLDPIRYNVIKPLKMTEYCQRIYFRNSYGGTSFIDFTGKKAETRSVETATYNKNLYDYYTNNVISKEKPYDKEVKYDVTLKSHIFEEDGKYIYNDLVRSPYIWTTVNNKTYEVILDSVSVDEVDNSNNLYEATIKYHYSNI